MDGIEAQIRQLEIKLLHTDMKGNPSVLNALLAEDFEEIGSTGRIGSRQAVIDWLLNKSIHDRWSMIHFRVKVLSDDLVLAIYQAQKIGGSDSVGKGSIRSSIWKRTGSGWKMVFHQGSKLSS